MIDQAVMDRWNAKWLVTEEKVSEAVSRIVNAANPLKIIAFGSRARGTSKPDSDLDLAVIVESVQPGKRPVSSAILTDLCLPVDLLVRSIEHHDRFKPFLNSVHYDIAQEGVVLYDRERDGRTDQTAIKKVSVG
jgi:predicted nucleotidyltransferase